MKINTPVGVLVGVLAISAAARAQSLADIARKEAERRKTVATPAKVYTDSDLRVVTPPPPPEPPPVDPSKPPEPGAKPDAKPADKPAEAATPAKAVEPSVDMGEQYWRKQIDDARGALARSRSYLQALDERVRALTLDFYAREDPAQRNAISVQRSRAMDDMKRLQEDMAEQEKAIAKIEADARKAGVPPGWIR
jgi:hypothetical protein